ncbi:MAG: hypothetical protein RLZZ628_1119 [Bacteroidota bacterium]|jgi:hypothetical protein
MSEGGAQPKPMQASPQPGSNNNLAILIGVLAVTGVLGYFIYKNKSDGLTSTSIPKAMQITFVPADFKPNLDEETTLRILSNPQKYKKEFDKLVSDFNITLLMHVANRMGLTPAQKEDAVSAYNQQHPYIRQMYYNDFTALQDTTSQLYQVWYENHNSNAVALMNEVASKYTCMFVGQVLTTVLKTQDGKLAVKGSKIETPCGIALTEALRPMVKRLQDKAAIQDFSQAKGLMKERTEKAIAELAVTEVRDKKGIKKQFQTKVAGLAVSQTEIQITAVSILKIGFNLNQYFDVVTDNQSKTITVTMPNPVILSHEVYPKVEGLDIGWLREVSPDDFNKNVNELRKAFRDDATKSDAFEKSKERARGLLNTMLLPMVQGVSKDYKLKINFKAAPNQDYDLPADAPVKPNAAVPNVKKQPSHLN